MACEGGALATVPADPGQRGGHPLLHHAEHCGGSLRLSPAQNGDDVEIGVLQQVQRQPIDGVFVLMRQLFHGGIILVNEGDFVPRWLIPR